MKYEIIKGSEKDFEFCDDDVLTKYRIIGHDVVTHSTHSSKKLKACSLGHVVDVIAERRPITEQVWDGEGVPAVGQKVMTKSVEGIIDYVGSGVIVYSNDDGQWSVRCDSLDYALSATRSPEDVARDVATKAFNDIGVMNLMHARHIYDAIAAGKIPGVKLEVQSAN